MTLQGEVEIAYLLRLLKTIKPHEGGFIVLSYNLLRSKII